MATLFVRLALGGRRLLTPGSSGRAAAVCSICARFTAFDARKAGHFRFFSSDPVAGEAAVQKRKVPISLLSGFLGSGKTTLLQEVLQNKKGLKVIHALLHHSSPLETL